MSAVPTLYVRNVPPKVYKALKRWAGESGRSVNAEALAILEREAARREQGGDWFDRLLEFRKTVPLSDEAADLAIAAIRAHREGR